MEFLRAYEQFEKVARVIRNMFVIAFPTLSHRWEQDRLSAYQPNVLLYALSSQFKKNPLHTKLLRSIKGVLSYHFSSPFEIITNSRQIQFSIPYLSDEIVESSSLLEEEFKQLCPLIIRTTEIYPALRDLDWDIYYCWRESEKIRKNGLFIRKEFIPILILEAIKLNFYGEYSELYRGLLLSKVISVELIKRQDDKKLTAASVKKNVNVDTEVKERPAKKNAKKNEITEKIAVITRLIPKEAWMTPIQGNRTCFRIKMSMDRLEKKLAPLREAIIRKSKNGSSLLIQFEDHIQIRLIAEPDKAYKKNEVVVQPSWMKYPPLHRDINQNSVLSQTASAPHTTENKSEAKIEIKIVYAGREMLPIREPLSDKTIQGILDAIAKKLNMVANKSYRFSNPRSKAYIELSKFIQLSYIIKTLYDDLIIRAFGGVWRSLLMAEDLNDVKDMNDVDKLVVIPAEFDVEKNLFDKLKELKVIPSYTKSKNPHVDLYTVPFLNTIHEITVFRSCSVAAHARKLNYNCNILSLEILRFYFPRVEFYVPLSSTRFVQAIRNREIPVIESVNNPKDQVFLLNELNIKNQLIRMIQIIFPHQELPTILTVMEKLMKNPGKAETIQPTQLTLYLVTLLAYVYDPKNIFNLLILYQSNYYHLSKVHHDIITHNLIPKIWGTVVTFEEKANYPFIQRKQLFHYFREYLMKSCSRQPLQQPILSDLTLLKFVLIAGLNLNPQEMSRIDTLFEEAKCICHDTPIKAYLSNTLPQSLVTHKQATVAIDIFLTAITLTRTTEIFLLVKTMHPDAETFVQFYLLPPFKEKRREISGFFHYIPQEPESVSDVLLNKWREYSIKDGQQNPYRLMNRSELSLDHHPTSLVNSKLN
jgi:hypothetical protein